MADLSARFGKRYNIQELRTGFAMLERGCTFNEVALALGRSPDSVKSRFKQWRQSVLITSDGS